MRIPQIRIEQTFAQIGMETIRAKQEIRQPKAELNLRQVPAKLTIERTPGRLLIDQKQAWNDRNLKDPLTLTRDEAERARQLLLEGIARIAQEGDRLAAIEKGGNPIAEIAWENANPGPLDFNYGVIPRHGAVKIRYLPAQLRFHWTLGGATLDPVIHKPVHHYTPGKVNIYLRQRNSLSIDVVGLHTDQRI
ncbi:hypothetical protein BSNK01_30330 [Bacillaceae bacterium]